MGTAPQIYPRTLFGGFRVLGNDLAPPRQAYFTTIPAVLILAAGASWMMGNDAGFVLGAAVATVIGFRVLWQWIFQKGATRLSTLMAMALLLGYGAGALNTWATLPRGSLTISATFGLAEGVLARGMGAVLASSALLIFLGEIFEKPIFGRDFHFTIDARTRAFVYAGGLLMLIGYLHHSMGIGGATSAQGYLSIFGSFLNWAYPSLTALSVVAFLTARSGSQKVFSGIACLGLLMLFSLLGRRVAIYTSVEILFLLELSGYQLRKLSLRNLLFLVMLGAVIVVCSLTFMLLRIAGGTMRRSQEANVSKRIDVARRMVQQGGAYSLAASSTQSNLQSRTFVLGFLANILEGSRRTTPAMGVDAAAQIEAAIPRVLYPGKNSFFSEEGLVDQQFGYGYGDEANSILTAGATDFGLIGMVVYPLLLIALLRLVYDFLAGWFRKNTLLIIALALIYNMLQTECTLTGYIDLARSLVIFGLVIAAFMASPAIRLRAE